MKGKKFLSLASAAILGLSAIPMSVSAADNVDANGRDLKYDMNMDGVVNYTDSVLILEFFVLEQQGLTRENFRMSSSAVKMGMTEAVWDYIEANGDLVDYSDGFKIDGRDAGWLLGYLVDTGWLFGDVNEDGEINAVDASLVLSYYAKVQAGEDVSADEYVAVTQFGDRNGDFRIDAVDASDIIETYAENQTKQ